MSKRNLSTAQKFQVFRFVVVDMFGFLIAALIALRFVHNSIAGIAVCLAGICAQNWWLRKNRHRLDDILGPATPEEEE